jgi:protein-L-isoaspartate O-methyltransferase
MATIASAVALTVVLATRSEILFGLAAAACLFFTSFVWGSSVQAARRRLYPPLTHLTRRQYAETWDSLAASQQDAYAAAAGQYDEHGLRTSANSTIANILELASVTDRDEVLEIGCGVGRIGRELASHCCTWTGADRSVKMLGHAADRLSELRNVRLVLLQADGLKEFEANSFDVVSRT